MSGWVPDYAQKLTVERAADAALEVARPISAALARRAQREFAGIHVDERNGVVTLSGTVASLRERPAACGLRRRVGDAWRVGGGRSADRAMSGGLPRTVWRGVR